MSQAGQKSELQWALEDVGTGFRQLEFAIRLLDALPAVPIVANAPDALRI